MFYWFIGCCDLSVGKYILHSLGILPTAASGLSLRLGVGGIGNEFLAAMFAAKIECLSIAVGVDRGGLVNGHPTDGIFGSGFCSVHNDLVFLGYLLSCLFPTA